MNPEEILPGIAAPVAISAVLLLVAWRPWRGAAPESRWPAVVTVLAIAAGYITGQVMNLDWPEFPALGTSEWPFWFALGAVALSLVEVGWQGLGRGRWLLRLLLIAVSVWTLVGDRTLWLIGGVAGIVALTAVLERLEEGLPRGVRPACLWLVASATSGALVVSGSASLGLMCGALAAALGPLMVLHLWRPWPAQLTALSPLVALLLGCFWINGCVFSELPLISAALLLLAACAAWSGRLRELAPWKSAALSLVMTLIPLAVALWLAVREAPPMDY